MLSDEKYHRSNENMILKTLKKDIEFSGIMALAINASKLD